MATRFILIMLAFMVLGMQIKPYKTYTTSNFNLRYEKTIPIKEIEEIGKICESKYNHYRNNLGTSLGSKSEIFILNTVGRFRAESQSRVFDDGDYRAGKFYLLYSGDPTHKENLPFVISRMIVKALLEKNPTCPEWLAEAYSLYAENDLLRYGKPARVNIASLNDLTEDYNRATSKKDIKELYAKLAFTIKFLVNRYGENKVEMMLKKFKSSSTLEEVFEASFNENFTEIERAWAKALQFSVKE
ncbi:MAG: hypothetical protein QME52_12035 [Bacteroidota bacterium]|nr:hypothetical protein [Bacteroidota bacterium]